MALTDPFDVGRLQIAGGPLPSKRPQAPRHHPGEPFLKGPVPWSWLERAMQLPGKALAVGLVAWHLRGMRQSNTFRLAPSKLRSAGLSPRVARRGLKALEGAGLVAVDRHRGCAPDLTLLSA